VGHSSVALSIFISVVYFFLHKVFAKVEIALNFMKKLFREFDGNCV
jgi:hypothetical protein